MKLFVPYNPPNWNAYIKKERGSLYGANSLKQHEKRLMCYLFKGQKWKGKYPVEMRFTFHFKDRRQDIDNARVKGLLDGLVEAGVLINDNLTKIRRVILDSAIDNRIGVEIEIKEYKE